MRVIIEKITPERASELLKQNDGNRRLRNSLVKRFATAMARGEWKVTHQSIAVDIDGRLLDGQHRLAAVVKYGEPVLMSVAYGVSRDTFGVLDQGAKRGVADHFGSNKFITQPLAFLARIVFHFSVSIAQMEQLRQVIQPQLDRLCQASGTNRRGCSTAAVKAAAIMTIIRGGDANRVVELYDMLVNFETDNPRMPPAAHAFRRQMESKQKRTTESIAFVKALRMFDPDYKNSPKLLVHNVNNDLARVRDELMLMIESKRDVQAA